ncbi:hypothetical protein BUV99_12920, partial [Corynebacterium diphtheriae]
FIVGVETPMGQFTYHYPIVNWGLFQVRELDKALNGITIRRMMWFAFTACQCLIRSKLAS